MNDPQSLEELPDLETFASIIKEGDETLEQKNFLLQKYQDTALELARGDNTINSYIKRGDESVPPSENYDSFSDYVIKGVNKVKTEINAPRATEIYTKALREKYGDDEQYQNAAKAINDYTYFGGPPTDTVIEDLGLAQKAFNDEVNYSAAFSQKGSLTDSVGNSLADFNVLYNSKRQPEYVRISLNNEGLIYDDPQTADLVKLPKDLNPVKYYIDSLKKKRDEIKDTLDENAIILDGYFNPIEKEKIAQIQTLENQIKMAEQFIAAKNQSFIDDATQKGVDAYVQDYIREQARNGNPKFQNIGNNLLEGVVSTVWGGIRRAATFLEGAAASIDEQAERALGSAFEALGQEGIAEEFRNEADLASKMRAELSARAQRIASEQRFSGLEVTNPYAGELLRDVADAIYQGSESVVSSGAGYLLGGPPGAIMGATGYSFLQAAGSKSLELSALEQQRRRSGDIEGADYIRNNQGYLSLLRGAAEALTERFSPGDVAFGALSRGRRAISRFSGELASEGAEEGVSGLADAVQGFYFEGKSAEQTAEAVAGLPKDVLLGAVGAVLPVGIRTLRGSLKNTSDQVDREVVKEVVKNKLQEVEVVAQEQGITKAEAAKSVLNNRDAAINAANEYIRTFKGNLGDNPKPSITSNLETPETETVAIDQEQREPGIAFPAGFNVLTAEETLESAASADEVIEANLDAQGEYAPVRIQTKPQSTSEESPSLAPQDIEIANGQIAAVAASEDVDQIPEEIAAPIKAMTPQEARDVASFVVSGLQFDPATNSYRVPRDAEGKPTLGADGVSIVADFNGNQRLIPTQDLISEVNAGNIDPNTSLFYIPQQLREDQSQEARIFLNSIPSRNVSTFNPDEVGIKFWEQAAQQTPQQQTQEGEQAQPAEGEVTQPAATPQVSDASRVIAYAAQLKRRGNQAIADMIVDRAIAEQDPNERKRENDNQNNRLFSPAGNQNPRYYFNGIQNDLDGEPFLDLYTINDESHPYHGSTISVPHGSTPEQVEQAIEVKRGQRFSPEGRSLDDSFAQLQRGVTLTVPSLVESLSESQDRLIANTAAILRELPSERVANVQVSRDNSEPRSYYQRPTAKEPAKIVLGRNASESTLMHEILHAYTDPLIDQELGAALDAADTGVKYKQALDDYLKNGKNIKLKIVLENYITIVNALGYADDVFGEKKRDISKWNGDPLHYGLQDIREFCSELITEPALAERINAIKNPYQESLFKRLIRAILDFFQSTLLKGYSPFFNKTFADLIVFINEGEVLSSYERDLVRRNPPSLNTQLSKHIQQAYELSSSGTLTQDQRRRLSSLNHQKANASPAIKDTTIYARPITRDELLGIRRIESLRTDTAIDVTLESAIDQMIPEGLALIWDEKANGGSFVSVLNDESLSSEDIDVLKKRGIDVITEQDRPSRGSILYSRYGLTDVVEDIKAGRTDGPLKAVNEVVENSIELLRRRRAESERRAQPRQRGKLAILDNINRAAKAGRITTESARVLTDFINGLEDRFISNDALSLRVSKGGLSNGYYNFADSLATVFINKGDITRTAIHEFFHGLSRLIPDSELSRMKDDYAKALNSYIKENPDFYALVGRDTLTPKQFEEYKHFAGKKADLNTIPIMDWSGKITRYEIKFTRENYRYKSLDEWVVENLTDVFLDKKKVASPDSAWGRFIQFLKDTFNRLKEALGQTAYQKFVKDLFHAPDKLDFERVGPLGEEVPLYQPGERRRNILYSKAGGSAGEKRPKPKKTREVEGVVFNEKFLTPAQKRRLTILNKKIKAGKIPSELALEEINEIKQQADAAEFSYLKMEYPEALDGKDIDNLADAQLAVIDWLEDNPEDPKLQDAPKKTKARLQKVIDFRDAVIALRDGDFTDFNNIQDQRIKDIVNEAIDFMLNNFNPENISNRQLTAWTKALNLFTSSGGRNISGFARTAAKISTAKIVGRLQKAKKNVADAFNESPDIKIFGMPISDIRRGKSKFRSTRDILESLADVSSELDAIFNRKDTREAIYSVLSDYHTSLNDFHILEDELLTKYKERIKSIQDRYKSRGAPTLLDDSKIQIAKRVTQFEIGAEATPLQQIRKNLEEEQESIRRKLSVLEDKRMLDEGRVDQEAFNQIAQPLLDAIDDNIITDEQSAVAFIENALDDYQLEILKLVREPGKIYWNQLDVVNQLSIGIPGSTRKQLRPWANYAKRSQRPLRTEDFTAFSGEAGFNSALSVLQPRQGLGSAKNNVFTSSWQSDLEQQLSETAYEITTGPARVQLFQAFRSDQMVQVLDDGATNAPRTDRMKEQLGNIHVYTRNNDLKVPALWQAGLSIGSYAMALKLVSPHQPLNQMIPILLYNLQHPESIVKTVISRMFPGGAKQAQDAFIEKYSPNLHNRMKHYEQLLEKGKTSGQRRALKTGLEDLDTVGREISRLVFRFARPVKNVADVIASFPIHLSVGIAETFSAKSVFLSLYADELVRRGLISDSSEFLSGKNMIYDKEALTFAELELDRYTLAPLRQANRGEMWQRVNLGRELLRIGAYALSRTAIQQSIKSTTAARDVVDAAKDAARFRNTAAMDHLKEKVRELTIQLLQTSFYYGIRAASMKIMLNLGAVGTFITAAAIEGSEDDKEKWMRYYRNLFRIYSNDQEKFLFQQFITDQLYTIMPYGVMQNNVGRGAVSGLVELLRIWPFNIEELEKTKEDLRAQQKQVNEQIKAYERLGQVDKAIELDVAREYLEYAILEADNNIKNRKHIRRNFIDAMVGEILPSAGEVRALANYFDNLGLPNNDPVYNNIIQKAKNNNAWWAISAALGIANPARKAADRTIKAKAQAEAEAAKAEERRYNKAIDDLNEVSRIQDIQVPAEFSETVPPRYFE